MILANVCKAQIKIHQLANIGKAADILRQRSNILKFDSLLLVTHLNMMGYSEGNNIREVILSEDMYKESAMTLILSFSFAI
jgi:hypothetical protein